MTHTAQLSFHNHMRSAESGLGKKIFTKVTLDMNDYGLHVKGQSGSKRVEIQCEHQNGILYVVPSETSWVCREDLLHVHALAGFLKQLVQLDDDRVKKTMQRWGLYFRERDLAHQDQDTSNGH